MGKGEGGFKRNGKVWARRCYEGLEGKLMRVAGEYLDWEMEECVYLGKAVPDENFPWGNKAGGDFETNANRAVEKMVKRSVARVAATVILVAAGVGGWWWRSP
jgi:hypothetical protein